MYIATNQDSTDEDHFDNSDRCGRFENRPYTPNYTVGANPRGGSRGSRTPMNRLIRVRNRIRPLAGAVTRPYTLRDGFYE